MSDIPADVMQMVRAIAADDFGDIGGSLEARCLEMVQEAIHSERERCAKIAEASGENAVRFMNEKIGQYDNDIQRFSDGCKSVANLIRGGN